MPQRQFELSTLAPVPPDFAFQFLLEMNNHRHLHPFFVQAQRVGSGKDEAGQDYQDFIITERPGFMGIRYTITFPTRQIITGPRQFTSQVRAALGTRLTNVMRCQPEGTGTRITESVTVQAPWLTIGYVTRQALKAHQATFDRLPAVLTKID
jgi:hypothetical protein